MPLGADTCNAGLKTVLFLYSKILLIVLKDLLKMCRTYSTSHTVATVYWESFAEEKIAIFTNLQAIVNVSLHFFLLDFCDLKWLSSLGYP